MLVANFKDALERMERARTDMSLAVDLARLHPENFAAAEEEEQAARADLEAALRQITGIPASRIMAALS